jgi:hypothetical protein
MDDWLLVYTFGINLFLIGSIVISSYFWFWHFSNKNLRGVGGVVDAARVRFCAVSYSNGHGLFSISSFFQIVVEPWLQLGVIILADFVFQKRPISTLRGDFRLKWPKFRDFFEFLGNFLVLIAINIGTGFYATLKNLDSCNFQQFEYFYRESTSFLCLANTAHSSPRIFSHFVYHKKTHRSKGFKTILQTSGAWRRP